MLSSQAASFRLPDTLAAWPWTRRINPHYAEVKEGSAAWLESFHAFGPKAQRAFNLCDFNLLASLAYPIASKEQLRTGCDLMNVFFVFDEYSDVTDEKTVQGLADIIMDALRNPFAPRPAGENVLGEITRQFWERAIQTASPASQRRFIATFDTYCQSVVQQAADRDVQHVRTIDSYFENRRENIGARPSFALLELDMDLPDEVMEHPAIVDLTTGAIDMLILGNDICSYNVEQARGDDAHNIVTVVMDELGTDLHGAMEWVAERHRILVGQFLERFGRLPSWGPEIDAQVARYVDGLGNWVRANDSWSFESQRYFGLDGLEIKESRWVQLLRKVSTPKLGARKELVYSDIRVPPVSFVLVSICLFIVALNV
ncbi:terpenoid synthase [Dichomitus squalens]|uniref:Terpene synthase n=1 Tax=Dichomitus squalens TaxID=114155 RepID=A0A4Q9MPH2_9APHY|nr:terpenoid synthase [Dichomitus squalens]